MSKYKTVGSGNMTRYMCQVEGDTRFRFVGGAIVPKEVKNALADLEPGAIYDTISQEAEKPVQQGRNCIFCGESGTRRKSVFLQIVFLCDQHYETKTTGEVGQKIKEVQHAEEKETAQV